jgi:hypothetical protein
VSSLEDPRGREVDEYAWQAEQRLRANDLDGARELYERAAALEQEIAEAASDAPVRVKSVLAVSAVALWYKAGRWSDAERLAHRWLAEANMTGDARDELQDLLQRCWVEPQLDSTTLQSTLPLELRLVGGEVRRGLAPARIVRKKQQDLIATLERIAEWRLGRDYRERGTSNLAGELDILQAPARAASYGVRLYVRTSIEEHDKQVSTGSLLNDFFELARGDVEAIDQQIGDPRYRLWFTKSLRNLCADGEHVEDVIYSSPTWRIRLPEVHLDRAVRQRLDRRLGARQQLPMPTPGKSEVEGTLNAVRLTAEERTIEICDRTGVQIRITLVDESHDDIIGTFLNTPVLARVRAIGRDLVLEEIRAKGLPAAS